MPNPRPNPYVGPRSFRTGETLYGRDRETLELLDLLIAERIVLLYSPSGAGKTSLIQAALVPKLREEGFNVLPPLRVNAEPPVVPLPARPGARPTALGNRFVLSALLSLEEQRAEDKRLPLTALAGMSFEDYIQQRIGEGGGSPLLIFDQFEEILTTDATNHAPKQEFFDQIGEALRDRSRWALFSMREDYLAGLDPYVRPIPTRFSTTYRLDLLGIQAAREAITRPARAGGVDFTDPAASKLVDDLRRVQVQRPDGTMEMQPGPYVEPVQLQVVCYRLWDRLPGDKTSIAEGDVAEVGDVNTALSDYYATAVAQTVTTSGETERAIREWFDRQLITEQGIRNQVLMEPDRSRGLSNRAIRMLEDAHLVRADERRGATWFELSHDRLIEPIRSNNAAWFREHLSALQQQADLWNRQGRQDDLLLRARALEDAEKWAQQHAADLTPLDKEFLEESRRAHQVVLREQRQNRRIRFLAFGATILSVIAVLGICVSLISLYQLGATVTEADNARATAVANEAEANRQKLQVTLQERVARMTAASLSQLNVDPEVSLLLATEAYSSSQTIQTDDALRQALAESRLRATWHAPNAALWGAAFSADGRRAGTAGGDGRVLVWDVSTGQVLQTLRGAQGNLWSVAFSPDGKSLAAGGDDKIVRIWDLTACKPDCPVRELPGHTDVIYSVAFSPDGATLASASVDKTARIWDVASGQSLHVLSGHTSAVNSTAFSPDGATLVTAGADQTLRVWDLNGCNPDCPSTQLVDQAGPLWFVSYSPDGQSIVAGGNDQVAVKYDAETGSVLAYFVGHNDTLYSGEFSPDGKYLVTGSRDGTARIWDAETGQVIAILRGHEDAVNRAVFSPDGQWVLTASPDWTAKLWSASNGQELTVLRGNLNKVYGAAYSPDGRLVATAGADQLVRIYDAATGAVLQTLRGHEDSVLSVAFSPDGKELVTASADGTARRWELTGCNPDCPVAVLGGGESAVESAAFSPDGERIITSGEDQLVHLWDEATGREIGKPLSAHDGVVYTARYSPDGKSIVTSGQDAVARVWDAATGQQKLELKGHSAAVVGAAFSPDGKSIVTASDDRTARIWDATTGKEMFTLQGHTGPVASAAFSSDGKWVVTASSDKTARVWDAATGREVGVLRGHTDKLWNASFSPDGKYIVTSSSDRTARISLAKIEDVLALARTRFTRNLSCVEWATFLQDSSYCPTADQVLTPAALPTSSGTRLAQLPTRTRTRSVLDQPSGGGGAGSTLTPTSLPTPAPSETPTALPVLAPTLAATATLATQGGGNPAPTTPTRPPATPTRVPATLRPSNTPTRAKTATPAIAPGVYAQGIRNAPIDPNERPLRIVFTVKFLNTTGADVNYSRWLVAIFRPGESKSLGDVKGAVLSVPAGESELATDPWRAPNTGGCEPYTAIAFWIGENGGRVPFLNPDGSQLAVPFPVCS